ncbi:MAG: hypothetical protein EPN17_18245 [Methylobacter sp.]|nr:MAG: hypothetical protein EPN17_18245 [Methylobacter sp.]
MAEPILARIFDDMDDLYEWSDLVENAAIRQGSLQQLAQAAANTAVILLLPATEVLLIELNLPISSHRQLKKALPYALEDYLANDVEAYHWVWSKQPGDKIAVAAIAHQKLASWLQCFSEAGIKLQGVYAETLFVPVHENTVSILLDKNRAIVRFSPWHGGGIDRDFLPAFIENTLAEHTKIQLWHSQPCADLNWPKQLTVNCIAIDSALSQLRPDKKNELNLLAGIYSPDQPGKVRWKTWLPAATLMLLAALMQYGAALTSYRHSQTQLAELENSNRQLFRQTFPQIKRIVNIKAQAEQELLVLRKHRGNNGSIYLRLLYQSAQILSQDALLQLQALDFVGGVLSLHLTGVGIAQIENFKQLMEKNPGVKVNIQSAETGNNGLSAHIDISEQAS